LNWTAAAHRNIEGVNESLAPADRKIQRQANRRSQSRVEILDAAERVFGEYGLRDGSTRKIAYESGFSTASIYVLFENKKQLLAETLIRRSDELAAATRASVDPLKTPLENLHRMFDAAIEFFGEMPSFRLMLRQIRGGPTITWPILEEYSEEVHKRSIDAMEFISSLIRDGQDSGQIRTGNCYALAHLLSVLVTEFISFDAEPNGTLSRIEFHAFIDGSLRATAQQTPTVVEYHTNQ
jgi:AcrR family transcriptional regulator